VRWVAEPRQLCRIFAPWDRTLVVTGDQVIDCRSQDSGLRLAHVA
jgi:hypothetical protein